MGPAWEVQALCPGFTRTEFHARIPGPVERHPQFLWLSARTVVAYSLHCLDRGGPVVCVPGLPLAAVGAGDPPHPQIAPRVGYPSAVLPRVT